MKGVTMVQSKYEGQAGVQPVKIVTFRSVRRRVRRGDFEELGASVLSARSAVERWDINRSGR